MKIEDLRALIHCREAMETHGSRPVGLLSAILCGLLTTACMHDSSLGHRGGIVLITLDGLRADVVGALGGPPGLTPNLDALCAESEWAGTAVAPSSWTVPSMASLVTGLSPWQHQALYGARAVLRNEHWTLAEALRQYGFSTKAFRSNYWTRREFGYAQGFEVFAPLRQGHRAERTLFGLQGDASFVWVDLPEPSPPYRKSAEAWALIGALADAADLARISPEQIEAGDLEPYFDPARPLPAELQREFWSFYLMSVFAADRLLGEYLTALRQSGHWDDTLLVVTSTHGTAVGEYGRVGAGGGLGRRLIEVPLLIKMPVDHERRIDLATDARPALPRVWATLIEAVGGCPVPAAAPSLFRAEGDGVLSELYFDNGQNHFSWVRGGWQLLRSVQFAPPEREFFSARMVLQGLLPADSLVEPAADIFGRLDAAFRMRHPFYGQGGPPESRLVRWTSEGTAAVDDAQRNRALSRELEEAWLGAAGELRSSATPSPEHDASRR